jgi:hypothetical protein
MATRRAGIITVDFEARSSKLDAETERASKKLGTFGAAGLIAGRQIAIGAATASTGVKRLAGDVDATGRTLSQYAQGALHGAEALSALAASHTLALNAMAKYAATAGTSAITTNQLVNGYRALRIALSPTPFTVAAIAAGIAAEETIRLVNARGKLIEQQAIFAAANKTPIESVEAIDAAATLSGKKLEDIRSLYLAMQATTGSASPEELGNIARQFDAMADPIEKAELATKTFGASAGQALEELDAGFARATENVQEYGLTMDKISRQQVVQLHKDLLQIGKDIRDIPTELTMGINLDSLRAFTEEAKVRIVEVAALFDDLAKRGAGAVKSWVDSLGIPRIGGMEQRGTIEPPNWEDTNRRIAADAMIAAAEAARLRQRETLEGQKALAAESRGRAEIIAQQLADDAARRDRDRLKGIAESKDAGLLSQTQRRDLAMRLESASAVEAGANRRVKQLEAEAEAAKKAASAELELVKIRQKALFSGQEDLNKAAEQLYTAGKTPQEKLAADMRLAGDRAVAKTKEELKLTRPGATLSAKDEATIRADAEGKVLLDREAQWKTAVDNTTRSIHEKTAAQQLLNAAIGKGYDAETAAKIEGRLMERFGTDYTAPGAAGARAADVEKVRGEMAAEAAATHTGEVNTATAALREQLSVEQAIYDAQGKGAAAIEHIRLAYEAYQLFRKHASAEEIADMIRLNELRNAAALKGELLSLNLEISSTEAISAAEMEGAEAVRKATLDAKYAQMRQRNQYGPDTEGVIAATAALDESKHQAQILHDALATGMAYKDRLEALDKEIAALHDIEDAGKGTLETTLSLKKLEDERLQTMAQQALAMGRLQDGVRAFFLEMQREGETTAQIIYRSLEDSLNRFSDSLTKAMTGQKAGWGKMFKDIGEEMVRATIRQQAGHALGQLGPWIHRHWPNIPGFPVGAHGHPAGHIDAGSLPGIGQKSAAQILASWKQDGQTPQGAFWVQIAETGFSTNPQSSVGAPPIGFPVPTIPNLPWGAIGAGLGGAGVAVGSQFAASGGGAATEAVSSVFTPMAAGGDVDAGMGYTVGERGPEKFIPAVPGRVVPNGASGGGGAVNYTIVQDNRGTDPVLTEQRTRQGLIAAHNASVSNALAVQVEFQKRSPQ